MSEAIHGHTLYTHIYAPVYICTLYYWQYKVMVHVHIHVQTGTNDVTQVIKINVVQISTYWSLYSEQNYL